MTPEKTDLLEALKQSLDAASFIKLSLGKPAKGQEAKKCVVELVEVKGQLHGCFVTVNPTNNITKNLPLSKVVEKVSGLLEQTFLSATLFTAENDLQYIEGKKGKVRLIKSKPTQKQKDRDALSHNKKKKYFIDEKSAYLRHLGVTGEKGDIRPKMYSKFRQIAKFIEIIDSAIKGAGFAEGDQLSILDIGSGKGYLTFALYEYLSKHFSKAPRVTGVDLKDDMITLCNDIAQKVDFSGLKFEHGQGLDHQQQKLDILIALHACNTATDEAIFQGIRAGAKLIVCAPCCQHEIAPQLNPQESSLAPLVQHGLFKQRQADLVTDIARTLLMESAGYSVKVIEFISNEHTAKNVMIVGTLSKGVDGATSRQKYQAFKQVFGFKTHKLEELLGKF